MQPAHDNASVHSQNEVTLTSNVYQDEIKKMATCDEEKNVSSLGQQQPFPADQIIEEESYPGLVECAPFPTLASLPEITHTLSKTRTNQTYKSQRGREDSLKTATADPEGQLPVVKTIGEYYGTEGIKNPGWFAVVGTFLVNFFVFGTVFSWGNFQRLYLEIYADQTDEFRIAFVGTAANAMLLSTGLFIAPLMCRLGNRRCMAIGAVLAPLGLILASFATQLWHLYLSQGILFGLGGSFVFSPSITLPSQWFIKNRALATGLAVSGSGIGGVCISPMAQSLITTIGYRNALRAMGGMGFGLLSIATALAVSRYPPAPSNGKPWNVFDRSLLSWPFAFLLLFALLVPFGYVAPFFLTPTYAAHIGVDASSGSTLVSIMSAANAVCRISLGLVSPFTFIAYINFYLQDLISAFVRYFGDRYGRVNTIAIFTLLSGIFTMVVWQFATSYGAFVAYCVLFGLSGGAFVSLMPPVVADIVGIENIQKGVSFSYFLTMFGNLLGTPVSGKLQKQFGWTAAVQFPGAMTVAAGLSAVVIRFLLNRKFFAKV
ncbi:major facilitator superfamily domain-containing protein [Zychaea mexicana]|uniref:major facilitator superfamily domain-containing protein n=1 Tax=Zychaea mexicana TaxID=64656 RepID=UPI0022FE8326|nr:major facilitator superfamily domain-containing protein [Zychaea mexicana]KAI9488484.1 major facilitator superfamily domain-containing protein [Zychaea mexicana]